MKRSLPSHLFPCLLLVGLLSAGCRTTPEQKTEFEGNVTLEEITLASLRYEVIDFADEFARSIEFAADRIESRTDDPEVLRRALNLKMHAIPKAFLCLDHPSPVAGLLDLWTLAVQMDDYYRVGPGKDAFGELQPVVLETTSRLVHSVEKVMQTVCRPDSFEIAHGHITAFAADHPFEGDLFSSPSVTRALPERFVPASEDVFSSINSLETEVRQLQAKIGLYMEHLPRQARWQAERLSTELVNRHVSPAVTNAFEQLAGERQLILEDVDRQRLDTLKAVREEVGRMEQGLGWLMSNTLVEVEAIIDREQSAILAAIDKQRQQTLSVVSADLERVSRKAVDRAYGKVWTVLGVVWVGLAALLVLARLLFRPAVRSASD